MKSSRAQMRRIHLRAARSPLATNRCSDIHLFLLFSKLVTLFLTCYFCSADTCLIEGEKSNNFLFSCYLSRRRLTCVRIQTTVLWGVQGSSALPPLVCVFVCQWVDERLWSSSILPTVELSLTCLGLLRMSYCTFSKYHREQLHISVISLLCSLVLHKPGTHCVSVAVLFAAIMAKIIITIILVNNWYHDY